MDKVFTSATVTVPRDSAMTRKTIVGRGEELRRFGHLLHRAVSGNGSTLIVSGEAGIGKTHFVTECRQRAADSGFQIISGSASSVSLEPFQLFSEIIEANADLPWSIGQRHTSLSVVLLMDETGRLIAKASNEAASVDSEIITGMLSVVQDFIRDSLAQKAEQGADLGRLEYGDTKIIIERGTHFYLVAILKGSETGDIRSAVKSAFRRIEEEHGEMLATLAEEVESLRPVLDILSSLSDMKFVVPQELSGAMLENERNRISDMIL
ncbi:MAG: ATP-binding protein, partial [Thermoplasmata archaeon]|nr:ATP-binding protein [Thermoplasmata archaeon]